MKEKEGTVNPYERDLSGARFYLWASAIIGAAFLAGLIAVLLKDHTSHRQSDWQFFAVMTGLMVWVFALLAFMYFKVRREGRVLAERTHL